MRPRAYPAKRSREQRNGWEDLPPLGDAFWVPVIPHEASSGTDLHESSRHPASRAALAYFFGSGKGKERAALPSTSQATPGTIYHNEEVGSPSESPSEDEPREDECPQKDSSVGYVPPPYGYLFPSRGPYIEPENAENGPRGDLQVPVSTLSSGTPTSRGASIGIALADASAGPEEASAGQEEGELDAESTSTIPRKRKRVSFAGEMTGDAFGEPLFDDTSQYHPNAPHGRGEAGFDRTGHDQAIRNARQKARERMVKHFNTSLASAEYKVGDVVSGTIPPRYKEGKTGVLIGVIHEVLYKDEDDYKHYVLQTPFGIVDRPFAANELLHESMKPENLDELQALTSVSLKAACYRNALAMGTTDRCCHCINGCTY
ncbi:hypothetical protein B0J12DRAFT_773882 [Macrophomina phaseolina]|uniref:Uncharacterized protein n=1 Tax=Macrophomina phaseolina TaxID=35725 RepID=A0ABQ8FSB9_9PEZI|nr:hypothetical protein B0J12DRAFT_773882 [Macrophomina phaseolina]